MGRELECNHELRDLLSLLVSMSARFMDTVDEGGNVKDLQLAIICAWGKHRSRWVVVELEKWLDEQFEEQNDWLAVQHLSENHRRRELGRYYELRRNGGYHHDAVKSAKGM